jgi:hypothetical protein
VFVWRHNGKRREMGLGTPKNVSLARVREHAQRAREAVADGHDPAVLRKAANSIPTFGEAADAFIEARTPSVTSEKSIARWKRTIGEMILPRFSGHPC